ncbi:uncharacterized protein (TIGR03083 family) [Kribbella amoyensis]|uniref:Uncharacterized protein (TIGR03083 family) n=1 Tax=Kribbella amoyensis TaxID=996641 RepID=A0A561B956_9ACTN|nr:maleylpyruvate isomerase family mycothiol-dependent enzyme [Kribbella amoyensis]TWD75288.1 uncharacterized protein (TIGR03083 family) [Kribbella amoyensis]
MPLPPERAAFYLAHLTSDSDRLAEVARLGLTAAVPSCPGWTVDDLVRHVATVYLHKVEVLRTGRRPDPWPPELTGRGTLDLLTESRDAVVAALTEAGTDKPTWTFFPGDQTSAFWYRRMALETVVHRVDAELAHAVLAPVDKDLAVDGIDELLVATLGGPWWEDGDTEHPVDAAVRITTNGNSWTVKLTATAAEVTAGSDGDVDAEIFGEPAAVYLWLWGRADHSVVQLAGDESVVEEFHHRLAECTT